jgi:hypothetical protein
MAVSAHELAVRDLGLDVMQEVSLADELSHLHSLRSDVIELQNCGVCQPACMYSARHSLQCA